VSALLTGLLAVQALLGIIRSDLYRDPAWVRLTWWGNDWVTLLLAVPMLWWSHHRAASGSIRARLMWLGMLTYAVYNNVFYLFGAALNVFFLVYVVIFVVAAVTLGGALLDTDARLVAERFRSSTPVRLIGGYLVFVGAGLATVWVAMWAAFVFAGRPTPIEPGAFQVVAAIDLSLLVPALATGGVWLWRRHPWGFIVGAMAAVEGALYLVVLTVNTSLSIASGLTHGPGELPVWGPLALATTAAAAVLLRHVQERAPHL
jgi:hypothetical protein